MIKKYISGLDELMIVNPGIPFTENDLICGQDFLGDDGTLYQVEGLHNSTSPNHPAEFYLGDNGVLYQPVFSGSSEIARPNETRIPCGQCFLGEDGTLYQVVAL